MDIQIHIDDDQMVEALKSAPSQVITALEGLISSASLKLQGDAMDNAPVGATGLLRNSIQAKKTTSHQAVVTGGAITAHPYAAAVELGTRPHFPPVNALKPWVRAKLGIFNDWEIAYVALAVARKIAAKGTEAQPFMQKATDGMQAPFARRLNAVMPKILAQVGK